MTDNKELIAELRNGCVLHPKRWSGDTHYDLGGSIREEATDELMSRAADALEAAERDAVTDEQVIRFMEVALRHVEYKRGTYGPTITEIKQGLHMAGIASLPAPPKKED